MMGNVNCLRCHFRHEDNGNCTEVGGFCTAVPAAHCPLLRQYLDTELTPEEIDMDHEAAEQLRQLCRNCDLDRLEELAEADRAGRLVVLPCQSGEHVFALLDDQTHVWECEVEHAVLDGWRKVFAIRPLGRSKDSYYAPFGAFGQSVFLTREAAEKALEAMKDGNG